MLLVTVRVAQQNPPRKRCGDPAAEIAADTAVTHCRSRRSVVINTTSAVAVLGKAVSDRETGDGDVRGEIVKDAESAVAVNRQTFQRRGR